MKSGSAAPPSIGERIAGELREFAITAVYLYVYFAALTYLSRVTSFPRPKAPVACDRRPIEG
jgi:hypothetical protein